MPRLSRALTTGALATTLMLHSLHASADQRAVEPAGPTPPPALDPALPTIWIAGDSTAGNHTPAATGWGRPFPQFFDTTKVNIALRARGGRSSRTFITEGHWDEMLAGVKRGGFRIWIIPHTFEVTCLRERKVGDAVNLEADLIGKYVEKFVTSRRNC